MSHALTGECWLVIEHARRGTNDIRVVAAKTKRPTVSGKQVAVKLELSLPSGLFVEPAITAKITVPADVQPEKISAETVAGVEQVLQAAGFVVRCVPVGDQS